MVKTISILGCGWLGLSLGKHLISLGYHVKGSTTTQNKLRLLEDAGIEPYLITLDPEVTCDFCDDFFETDILIVDIPPGIRRHKDGSFHIQQIESLQSRLNKTLIPFVIFISSTSVYPDFNKSVTEQDTQGLQRGTENPLLTAEDLLLNTKNNFETTVIRFAGLYGYDRHPVRYLAGRKNLSNGDAPVNMIHRDDCVNIITEIIQQNVRNEIFNACADKHPTRRDYYTRMALRLELEPPAFTENTSINYKIVSNEKLKKRLNYLFMYPSPYDGEVTLHVTANKRNS